MIANMINEPIESTGGASQIIYNAAFDAAYQNEQKQRLKASPRVPSFSHYNRISSHYVVLRFKCCNTVYVHNQYNARSIGILPNLCSCEQRSNEYRLQVYMACSSTSEPAGFLDIGMIDGQSPMQHTFNDLHTISKVTAQFATHYDRIDGERRLNSKEPALCRFEYYGHPYEEQLSTATRAVIGDTRLTYAMKQRTRQL